MGIERIAMLKYGIPDLRTFFEADLRWLRHYGFLPLEVPGLDRRAGAMKFTLSWLKEHLETDGVGRRRSREQADQLGLEVERRRRPRRGARALHRRLCGRGEAASRTPTGCASAWSRPARASFRSSAARPTRAPA